MQSTIPFTGFYDSDHSALLDNELESIFSDNNGDPLPSAGDSWEHIDWTKVHTEYAKRYADTFCDLLSDGAGVPIRLKFVELNSPRAYNFATDRIFVEVSQRAVKALYKLATGHPAAKAQLDGQIHEKFTSYDGFMSFYDNSLAAWPKNPLEWDANQIGTLIESVFYQSFEPSDLAAWAIMESASGNGQIDSMLWDALDADGRAILEAERKVADGVE
jgi:hypothetical protein